MVSLGLSISGGKRGVSSMGICLHILHQRPGVVLGYERGSFHLYESQSIYHRVLSGDPKRRFSVEDTVPVHRPQLYLNLAVECSDGYKYEEY
jgi:hypothetical protein